MFDILKKSTLSFDGLSFDFTINLSYTKCIYTQATSKREYEYFYTT